MDDRELLQQALDALNNYVGVVKSELNEHIWDTKIVDAGKPAREAIEAIKARLAQLEPDPQEIIAKWIKANTEHREWYICPKCSHQTPRWKDEWVDLTYEELSDAYNLNYDRYFKTMDYIDFLLVYEAVEQKLKDKNT